MEGYTFSSDSNSIHCCSEIQNDSSNSLFIIDSVKIVSAASQNAGERKVKKNNSIKAPQAPATAYLLYLKKRRKELEKDSISFPEVTKIIGKEWSELPSNIKNSFKILAEEDKARYRRELTAFRSQHLNSEEGLYCPDCQLYFVNCHNRDQHFLGQGHQKRLTAKPGVKHKNTPPPSPPICDPFDAEALQIRIQDIVDERESERHELQLKTEELSQRLAARRQCLSASEAKQRRLKSEKEVAETENIRLQTYLEQLCSVSRLFESDQYLNSSV